MTDMFGFAAAAARRRAVMGGDFPGARRRRCPACIGVQKFG